MNHFDPSHDWEHCDECKRRMHGRPLERKTMGELDGLTMEQLEEIDRWNDDSGQ